MKHISVYLEETAERFNLRPSDLKRQRIESDVEGVSIDWSDADCGGERAHMDYSHIPDSGSTEPY